MKSLAAFIPRRRKRSIIRRLSNFDVFLSLPPEDIQALLPYVKMMNFPAGTCLMREGDPGDALYLIESGDARVDRVGELKSWTLGRGTAVGEGALITGEPRSATVTAITDVSAWRINRDDFNILIKSSPRLHAAFVELVQNRRA